MKVLYNWLKDYLDVKLSPEKLGELLTMSGLPVESIEKLGDDHILEIEVTANRPDCLSVIGIAREVAALTGKKLKIPPITSKRGTRDEERGTISIKVEDKKLCPRYTGRVIRDVKVGESPAWLRKRIEAMGLRPVNNIVDITNFCLFETGEPMHAFDLDKISGGEVVVRRARKGEKMTTIDGLERTLDDATLIIADKTRPIAIAGVMGGLNTEVTAATKNVLLEAAYFDPVSVRRASRRLGLSTESSYMFERKVDIENIIYSSGRATALICETAGGRPEEFCDIEKTARREKVATLRCSRLNKILGLEIPPDEIKKILGALGLKAGTAGKDKMRVAIPSFRYDLQDEVDLIEEVARICGYGKIPLTIPAITEQPARLPTEMVVEKKIREILTGLGLYEIITYSLSSKRLLDMANLPVAQTVEIANPLSGDQEVMSPSLIAGMLNSILWNINRKNEDLRLFEVGKTYIRDMSSFVERRSLSIGMTGQTYSNWVNGSRACSFFDLKGILETLLSELGIDDLSLKETDDRRFSTGARAAIEVKRERVGVLGEIDSKILHDFDIRDKVYALEMDIDALIKYVSLQKRFKELPKYPSIFRDISIISGKEATNAQLMLAIKTTAGPVLKEVSLLDRYVGKQIPDGKVGLTYRLEYHDLKKTLEEKDILELHSKILHMLEDRFGARLR